MKQYFGTIIPANDNKFAALNSAVWSGGSSSTCHRGLDRDAAPGLLPDQCGEHGPVRAHADHRRRGRLRALRRGLHGDIYSSDSLHSAVVEIIVKPGGRCRCDDQNWSTNVYNLVTKRAVAYENATMEWVDGNLGSKLTMKYPAIWLMGEGAHGEVLSIAFGGAGQHQDAGGKAVHVAPNTTSVITSKSISKDGGRAGYRGLLEVAKGARVEVEKVVCDDADPRRGLALGHLPYMKIDEDNVDIGHEATVSKIGRGQLLPDVARALRGRGLGDDRLRLRRGDHEKELPLEYAVELNRLIQLQMEGSVD